MRCEYTLTWKLYCRWVMQDQLRGGRLVINILLLIFGVVNLVLAFPINFITLTQVSLFAVCVYMVFFNWRFNAKTQYKRTARRCGGEDWRRVITFGESAVTFSDGPSKMSLKYSDLTGIKETPDEVTLLFGKRAKLVLLPDAFTQGTWPQCRALLKSRMS